MDEFFRLRWGGVGGVGASAVFRRFGSGKICPFRAASMMLR